jgi:taurine dioxygenase
METAVTLSADSFGVWLDGRHVLRDPGVVTGVCSALRTHRAVVLGNVALDADGFVALAAQLGELRQARVRHPSLVAPASQYIFVSASDGQAAPGARKEDAGHIWHHDYTTSGPIPRLSLLYGVNPPPDGSRNGFVDLAAAYATLPAGLRAQADAHSAWHYVHPQGVDDLPAQRRTPLAWDQRRQGELHPLAATDAAGTRHLCLPAHHDSVVQGLDEDASGALLRALWHHALANGRPWDYELAAGEILMWDNQALAHRRSPWPTDKERLLWFISTK